MFGIKVPYSSNNEVQLRTKIELQTSRTLKAIKELYGFKNMGEVINLMTQRCGREFLIGPLLKREVEENMIKDLEESSPYFTGSGMSEEDILDLTGVSKDKVRDYKEIEEEYSKDVK
ncbi:MAG: hypothetical protein ACXQTP_02495 [Candidatus Methanofastidiosia archaeon]